MGNTVKKDRIPSTHRSSPHLPTQTFPSLRLLGPFYQTETYIYFGVPPLRGLRRLLQSLLHNLKKNKQNLNTYKIL